MTEEDKNILIKELDNIQEKLHFYGIMIDDLSKRVLMIKDGLIKDSSFKTIPDHFDNPGNMGIEGPVHPVYPGTYRNPKDIGSWDWKDTFTCESNVSSAKLETPPSLQILIDREKNE